MSRDQSRVIVPAFPCALWRFYDQSVPKQVSGTREGPYNREK